METDNNYLKKYLKYKNKYEDLKQIVGGGNRAAISRAMSKTKHSDSSTPNDDSKSNANVKVVGRDPAKHGEKYDAEVEVYCKRSDTYYSFNKNVIDEAKNKAYEKNAPDAKTVTGEIFKTYNYVMVDNEGNGLLNKLLNNLLDPKEHKNYFEKNSWMENSVVIGFRSEDDGTNPKLNQPVFYALDKQFFWQFEPEKNMLKPDIWFNVTPITIKEKPDDVITKIVIKDGFYVFKWSGLFGGEMKIFTEGGGQQHHTSEEFIEIECVNKCIAPRIYKLKKSFIKEAEKQAFAAYGVTTMLDNILGKGLLNQLLNTFTTDLAQHKNYFDTENIWMTKSFIVGLRSEENNGANPQPRQPVFYSPDNKDFWQFEMSLWKPGRWINNCPHFENKNNEATSDILAVNGIYSFEWSGVREALNAAKATAVGVAEVATATGAVLADAVLHPGRFRNHHRRDGVVINLGGGVRLDNLLPDPNLVNPPQIGGSEKI